ncbi:MAG: hypothetical protein KGY66_02240 [Candidatus Thermoplasmatota archaeon]|nr:hypothetical protein [Candidatus Thermoplasmatota archaeon]MBS3789715.1 hypothetical protein [Candidatus Thermoplasmatota archaeon]
MKEETICSVEINDEGNVYTAKLQASSSGVYKEYKNQDIEKLLEELCNDLSTELL